MKALLILPIFLTLCGCQKDAQTKLETCASVHQIKEVNISSSPQSYAGSDKGAVRLSYIHDSKINKIMLKASNMGFPSVRIDAYKVESNQDPDSGTHLGGTYGLAEGNPAAGSEVWFALMEPLTFDLESLAGSSVFIVFSFSGGATLDYGSTSGSSLRSQYAKSSSDIWGYAENSNGISFGYEGGQTCY